MGADERYSTLEPRFLHQPPAQQQGERTFTQEQVNSIIANERRRWQERQQGDGGAGDEPPSWAKPLLERLDRLEGGGEGASSSSGESSQSSQARTSTPQGDEPPEWAKELLERLPPRQEGESGKSGSEGAPGDQGAGGDKSGAGDQGDKPPATFAEFAQKLLEQQRSSPEEQFREAQQRGEVYRGPPTSNLTAMGANPHSALDRGLVRPNQLTEEQVRNMGPDKLHNYISEWRRKGGSY